MLGDRRALVSLSLDGSRECAGRWPRATGEQSSKPFRPSAGWNSLPTTDAIPGPPYTILPAAQLANRLTWGGADRSRTGRPEWDKSHVATAESRRSGARLPGRNTHSRRPLATTIARLLRFSTPQRRN